MKPWSRRDVLAYLERVENATAELDHFALLDVAPTATDADIQAAFHRVAGGIHPDRHRDVLTSEQRESLTIVYARIAEAYRVLRDPSLRASYMVKLHRDEPAADASTTQKVASMLSPKAERLYRRATTALRTGDKTSAILNLKMALRLHPTSDLLRDALSRALGK